jgi:hypothetical protein
MSESAKHILLFLLLTVSMFLSGQTTRFAVMLSGRVNPNFNLANITQAGGKSVSFVDSEQWLNYNVRRHPSDANLYFITVQLISGTIPPGVRIIIQAGADAGLGTGIAGTTTGPVELGLTPQVIINGIGNTNTGNQKNQGHPIYMTIEVVDFTLFESALNNLYIEYRLSNF